MGSRADMRRQPELERRRPMRCSVFVVLQFLAQRAQGAVIVTLSRRCSHIYNLYSWPLFDVLTGSARFVYFKIRFFIVLEVYPYGVSNKSYMCTRNLLLAVVLPRDTGL